uniref:uncharacterized protein LOC120339713 n=1 Tax=Styela clava TaxID=7725 RepID=UPI00193A79D9|nr:uncharacterized protein LOC120339713 [Styela clava]
MNGIKNIRPRKLRPQLSLRHVNSPVSPPPDQNIGIICSGVVPRDLSIHGQQNIDPDVINRIANEKIRIAVRNEQISRTRKGLMGYHRAANSNSLPPIKGKPSRFSLVQEMPKIYVCPAPKFIRQNRQSSRWEKSRPQKTYFHRQRTAQSQPSRFGEFKQSEAPYIPMPVTIPVQHGVSPVDERYHDASEIIERTINVTPENVILKNVNISNRIPKTVNLNESFEAVSAQYGKDIALNVALSRKRAGKKWQTTPARNIATTSSCHLPLREVYLKPDASQDKESYARYQQEKMIRIWNWLKKLNYLDDSQLLENQIKAESIG